MRISRAVAAVVGMLAVASLGTVRAADVSPDSVSAVFLKLGANDHAGAVEIVKRVTRQMDLKTFVSYIHNSWDLERLARVLEERPDIRRKMGYIAAGLYCMLLVSFAALLTGDRAFLYGMISAAVIATVFLLCFWHVKGVIERCLTRVLTGRLLTLLMVWAELKEQDKETATHHAASMVRIMSKKDAALWPTDELIARPKKLRTPKGALLAFKKLAYGIANSDHALVLPAINGLVCSKQTTYKTSCAAQSVRDAIVSFGLGDAGRRIELLQACKNALKKIGLAEGAQDWLERIIEQERK